ncbi:glycosyltransferase family 25 protein [Xenorhabdus sp. KK7.4]|uniref:glycosyltransferase family 25 protein n=1 Tax=Xenorhabdus sp. KK7.4 TaxID=1851572 RepID=UPI0012908924|nr:glycosyltransferase family 25 protein [Xenorhabdus sp. KK7.4]
MKSYLEDDITFDNNLIAVLSSLEKDPQALGSNPLFFLLNKTNEYFDSFKKPLTDEYSIVNVIDSAGAFGYILNLAAAKKLYQYLLPIRFAADEWKIFREHGAIKLKGVIPPVVGLTDLNLDSSIGNDRTDERTELDQQHRKKSFYTELKLGLWRIFIRAPLKKVKH